MGKLSGKVAIVTGASKGIGAGIAKGFAAAGASVIVNYASSREGADRVVAEICEQGGSATAIQGDVSKSVDVQRLFEQTIKTYGKVDVLMNNAGVYEFQPVESMTEAEFHRQFDINVLGSLLTIQAALKYFGSEGGVIINTSSIASVNPTSNSALYSATKGAIDTMTVALSRELGPRMIRVNAIAPGGIASEGLQRLGILGSDIEKQVIGMTPLGRFGEPDDIARVAVFLDSNEASFLAGERILVSGGWR
jgi:3-oxoacyl-[acyl-carrier protein] reductase